MVSKAQVRLPPDYPVGVRLAALERTVDALTAVLNTQGKALAEARRGLIRIAEDNQRTREVLADTLSRRGQ